MGKRKICCLLLLFTVLLLSLMGCEKRKKESSDYVVYYLNNESTKIIPIGVYLMNTDGQAMMEELLELLQTQPTDTSIRQTIPANVKVESVRLTDYQVNVDFSKEYYEMSPNDEVLTRAAIAKTLLQDPDYPYVSFTVESKPLENSNGQLVGSMGNDTFVENPGQQINSIQKTTLSLYFASKDGAELKKETRVVHYSSNISMEKLVMEQLMEGPKVSGVQATIPSGTKIINSSVVDGICYISLDETFLNQNPEITEQVVLYSIVNSLTELPNVQKVQVSINGDTSGKCRYTYELSKLYEADPTLVTEGDQERVDSTQ